ncbi:MAG: flagellar basal body rod protein FlgB [Rhodospirillales bacterium]
MNLNSMPVFAVIKKKVSWLTQRQEVLAQNIANADTPKYRPSDLRAFDFKDLVRRQEHALNMSVSSENHLPGRRQRIRDFSEERERRPFETAPGGNAVVLEEQVGKLNDNGISHELAERLYKKQLNMFKIAIGKA